MGLNSNLILAHPTAQDGVETPLFTSFILRIVLFLMIASRVETGKIRCHDTLPNRAWLLGYAYGIACGEKVRARDSKNVRRYFHPEELGK
jgi:hypothetical protein